MKNILLLLSVILLLFSCNKNKHEKELQQRIEERLRQDSIRQQQVTDSLALIAIGDAKFGMSVTELKTTELLKDKKYFTSPIYFNSKINELNYECEAILANDTLYKIRILTEAYNINEVDGYLSKAANNLKYAFTEKYGKPDISRYPLSLSELKKGKSTTIYRWKIGDKIISIDIYAHRERPTYKMIATVVHGKFEKIAMKEQLLEQEAKPNNNPL